MKVTPLDLQQRRFQTVMRGYDRGEVHAFLSQAAEAYESALGDIERLRQELSKSETVLDEHRSQEKNLCNTLMSAQKLADDIRENAQQESVRILNDAEARAELMMQKSQSRVEAVQREIDRLRLTRQDIETSLERIIATLNDTIAFVRDQDTEHKDEKILVHRPRLADAAPSPDALEVEESLVRTAQ